MKVFSNKIFLRVERKLLLHMMKEIRGIANMKTDIEKKNGRV